MITTALPRNIVTTRDQVAAHFGVHLRTVATWFAAGAPGTPGAYDLDAIAAWRRNQTSKPAPLRPAPRIPTEIRRLRAEGFAFHFHKSAGEIVAEHPDGREHLVAQLEKSEAFPRAALGRAIAAWLNGSE